MVVRIEFVKGPSRQFALVLRACQRFPTFKEIDGLYSVEFAGPTLKSFEAIYELICQWRGVLFYIDDVLVSRWQAMDTVRQVLYARRRAHENRATLTLKVDDFLGRN